MGLESEAYELLMDIVKYLVAWRALIVLSLIFDIRVLIVLRQPLDLALCGTRKRVCDGLNGRELQLSDSCLKSMKNIVCLPTESMHFAERIPGVSHVHRGSSANSQGGKACADAMP